MCRVEIANNSSEQFTLLRLYKYGSIRLLRNVCKSVAITAVSYVSSSRTPRKPQITEISPVIGVNAEFAARQFVLQILSCVCLCALFTDVRACKC